MRLFRPVLGFVLAIAFAAGLTACGDTWEGLKKDTSENLQKTGEALEKAGENLSK